MTMRKLIALVILSAASVASAGTYTVNTNASQDTRLARQLNRLNKATCASVGLPANCTQAEARAKQPSLDVYASVTDMLDRAIVGGYLSGLKSADTQEDAVQAAAAWVAMNDTQKNAVCALLGLPNGCEAWTR
jgi:hypothetical protein